MGTFANTEIPNIVGMIDAIAVALNKIEAKVPGRWNAHIETDESYGRPHHTCYIYAGKVPPFNKGFKARQESATICVSYDDYTKRINIGGLLIGMHDHKPYGATLPRITCAPTKSPEAIAKDIVRRVLPEYEPIFEATKTRRDASEAREIQCMSNNNELAAHLASIGYGGRGGMVADEPRSEYKLNAYPSNGSYERLADIEVRNTCARIQSGDLTISQAKEVLSLLASFKK